jgi:hypothetical protein
LSERFRPESNSHELLREVHINLERILRDAKIRRVSERRHFGCGRRRRYFIGLLLRVDRKTERRAAESGEI